MLQIVLANIESRYYQLPLALTLKVSTLSHFFFYNLMEVHFFEWLSQNCNKKNLLNITNLEECGRVSQHTSSTRVIIITASAKHKKKTLIDWIVSVAWPSARSNKALVGRVVPQAVSRAEEAQYRCDPPQIPQARGVTINPAWGSLPS